MNRRQSTTGPNVRPVDPDEPLHIVDHCDLHRSKRATAILIDPCTGALGATSYWISIAAAPPGRWSYDGGSWHRRIWLLPAVRPCYYQSITIRPAQNVQKGTGRVGLQPSVRPKVATTAWPAE